MKKILIFFIKGYQMVFRPYVGHHCRFFPSCSDYAIDALSTYGLVKGIYLIIWRLCRCHPWSQGGCDPVHKHH